MAAKKKTGNTRNDQIDAALTIGKETLDQVFQTSETVMRANQDALGKFDTKATVKIARDQFEATSKTVFAGQDHLTAFSMAAFDAYASAFDAFTHGTERFGAEVVDFTRESIETTVENGRNLMACGSVNEAFDLRNQITRATVDSAIARGTKLTEMSLKTANDGWAPIQEHAQHAFDIAKPQTT